VCAAQRGELDGEPADAAAATGDQDPPAEERPGPVQCPQR
jgi:hypothetical protein